MRQTQAFELIPKTPQAERDAVMKFAVKIFLALRRIAA
jgi:hypothetical protein